MNLTVTRLGPQDAARAQVNCTLFWDMRSASANLGAYLADPNCILLVAEVDGKPAGQIMGHILKRCDSKSPMLFLFSIDVVETHRRKGVARRLIEEFFRIGKEAGCGSSFVFTNEYNTPAMQMYQALGGTRTNPDDVMYEWKMDHEQMPAEAISEPSRSANSKASDAKRLECIKGENES